MSGDNRNDTCPGCFNGNNAVAQAFQPDIQNRQAGKPDLRKIVRLESLTYAIPSGWMSCVKVWKA